MRARDGKGLATRVAGGRSGDIGRGPLAAALLGIALLCCLLGLAATAGAAPVGWSAPTFLARQALQRTELTAYDNADGDQFGYSVAVSKDMALVGAPFHSSNGQTGAGAAYVFRRSGGVWSLEAELTAPVPIVNEGFGLSVALSGDTALIGAPGGVGTGSAYVFIRAGGSWGLQTAMVGVGVGDRLGYSVALSGDTALMGAPEEHGASAQGAAYVYTRSGALWTRQKVLTPVDGDIGDRFGHSVAVSGDTALVGSPRHDVFGVHQVGAVYVFSGAGGLWAQQAKLTADDGAAVDNFGLSVALSPGAALIGAPYHASGGETDAGAAYFFVRSGASWTQRQALSNWDRETPGDLFGTSVALSGDSAVVGVPRCDAAAFADSGAAYVFARSGGSWQPDVRSTGAAAGDLYGASVGVSGATVLVGAPSHDLSRADEGAAYVSVLKPAIVKLKPASARRGAVVTIAGVDFDAKRGVSSVKFGTVKCTKYVSWSATRIKCKVPAKAKYGVIKVRVTTSRGVSNAKNFRVKR